MDYAIGKKLVHPESQIVLAHNRLVLIAPVASDTTVELTNPKTWLIGLGGGALAMADPAYVPAGRYAKQALQSISIWPSVKSKVLGFENVRLALVAVERVEANLGIVYATDAAVSRKVKTLVEVPKVHHAPIVYPMAAVKGRDGDAVRGLMTFLTSDRAKSVLRTHRFSIE